MSDRQQTHYIGDGCPGGHIDVAQELWGEPIEGREYAVLREDGWHIATFRDGVFEVTSDWQSGDRWYLNMVKTWVLLPE